MRRDDHRVFRAICSCSFFARLAWTTKRVSLNDGESPAILIFARVWFKKIVNSLSSTSGRKHADAGNH